MWCNDGSEVIPYTEIDRALPFRMGPNESEKQRQQTQCAVRDWGDGLRGKFYRPDLELRIPIYLQEDIAEFLEKLAEEKGSDVETIVNDWLRRNISLVETTK